MAVTRRGETLGIYVPTPRNSERGVGEAELRAAADRLAEALSDVNEDELVADFRQAKRTKRRHAR